MNKNQYCSKFIKYIPTNKNVYTTKTNIEMILCHLMKAK